MKKIRFKSRGFLSAALALALLLSLLPGGAVRVLAAGTRFRDGSYQGTGKGFKSDIVVSVAVKDDAIEKVEVLSQQETPNRWEKAVAILGLFIGRDSADGVDAVSGATYSSNGIKAAVNDALAKASVSIGGSGTEQDPYVIRNAVQLQSFAEKVDAGDAAYTGAFVTLGADVDCSIVESWNPIGAEGKASSNTGKLFAGVFDGKGHSITHLVIGGTYDAEANIGLFSTLADTARVRNLTLDGLRIEARGTGSFAALRAGGVAGDTARTSGSRAAVVDGCTVRGTVAVSTAKGMCFAGGVLGRAFTKSAIVNCVSEAQVTAEGAGGWNTAYAGCIAGQTGNGVVLANCAALGSAEADNLTSDTNDAYAGGCAGMLSGTVYGCYSAADVAIAQKSSIEKQYVGVFAGMDSYSVGSGNYYASDAVLTVKDDAGTSAPVGARPWAEDGGGNTAAARTKAELGTAEFAAALNANLAAVTAALDEPALALQSWKLDGGRVILSGELWTPAGPSGEIFASGSGTKDDPFLIETAAQLRAFAGSLSDTVDYTGQFVRLGADVDLSGEDWTPVGGSSYRFNGEFDGASHIISGMRVGTKDAPLTLDAASAHIGLFGWLNEHAVIHDLTLEQVAIFTHSPGSAYVGGIAGRMSGSDTEGDLRGAVIDGCAVLGTIEHTSDKGTSFVGGICGHVFKGAIVNTSVDVTMLAKELSGELIEVGGVAGMLNRGMVANCCARGSVTGSGYRDALQDIEGMACVGGIAAVGGGTIVNCYSECDVAAPEYSIDVGVLAGWVTGIAKAYNCWYSETALMSVDGRTVSPVDPFGEIAAGGVSDEYFFTFPGALLYENNGYTPGAEGAERVAAGLNATFAAFPIDIQNVYGLAADSLRRWTAENGRAVLSAERATVAYVQPEVEKQPAEDPTLELRDGVWYGRSEDKRTVVKITVSGKEIAGTEVLQGEHSGEGYDYALRRAKAKSMFGDRSDYAPADTSRFKGSGTADAPYEIETEAQLRYLAEAINEDVDWKGVYFRQTRDIALTGGDWLPIGWGIYADADGDGFGQDLVALYPFRGSYDGGRFTISGLRAGTGASPVDANWMGLFGFIQGDYETNEIPAGAWVATLKNIRLEDVGIYTQNKWRACAGALVGSAQGGFLIDRCSASGTVSARSAEDFAMVGGLAGSLMYGCVSNCHTDVDVTAWSGRNYSYAAGMAASTNRATIVNSYALGDVHADADQTNRAEAGGFVGLDGGVCLNCYAAGDVEIVSKYSMYLGGFVGMAASSSEQRQCYFNQNASQRVAGAELEEKRFAGKFVNESAEAASQSQDVTAASFQALLESNRQNVAATLAEIREALGADETGSSKYHSVYFNGSASDLEPWVLVDGIVGFRETGSAAVTGSVSGNTLSYTVTNAPAGARLIAARYDASGRMTDTQSVVLTNGGNVSGSFSMKGSGGTYRLMLVDGATFAPLCEAWAGKA